MPLVSLLGFLQSESIRLTRADCFEDSQEGLFGAEEMLSHMPENMHERIKNALKEQTKETFITCWHYAASESLAMWKIYGGGKDAVACLLYTSPSPRDRQKSRMPSSA